MRLIQLMNIIPDGQWVEVCNGNDFNSFYKRDRNYNIDDIRNCKVKYIRAVNGNTLEVIL